MKCLLISHTFLKKDLLFPTGQAQRAASRSRRATATQSASAGPHRASCPDEATPTLARPSESESVCSLRLASPRFDSTRFGRLRFVSIPLLGSHQCRQLVMLELSYICIYLYLYITNFVFIGLISRFTYIVICCSCETISGPSE